MLRCDNDSSFTNRVVSPQCWKGNPAKSVTIEYNEVEKDTLTLCTACTLAVTKDAQRHGYKTVVTAL